LKKILNKAFFNELKNIDITENLSNTFSNSFKEDMNNEKTIDDSLLNEAIEFVIKVGQVSSSLIQRHFKIDYIRAENIIEQMERKEIISKHLGSKPREVLISMERWNELNGIK
jgi:S-DNA-T family DNA segregation ATPase FtsK/SpoIIIE